VEIDVVGVIGIEVSGFESRRHLPVQGVHPDQVARIDAVGCAKQRRSLESADDLVQMPHIVQGEPSDAYSPPRKDFHEALDVELDHRIPERHAADSEFCANPILVEEGPGHQVSGLDRGAQVLIYLLSQGLELKNAGC